jgi:hypothetical protein
MHGCPADLADIPSPGILAAFFAGATERRNHPPHRISDRTVHHASDRRSRRGLVAPLWVPAIVVAARFMFGVDACIVNAAIPIIADDLHAN